MAVHGVSHIAIGVSDLDRSVDFYRDVVGMPVVVKEVETFAQGAGMWQVGASRRAAYVRWREGPQESFVVLDQWPPERRPPGAPAKLFQLGVHHFGFWVDDVEAVLERARKSGHKVLSPPSEEDTKAYGEPPGQKVRAAFIEDPDGNIVQLDQRL
ncbi:VOC family protein [Phenylobacterium sp.]|jgi:catechol 2,3-dioxygenase-like lactoylglutathione lyase family enzyme|uniref:VOC family protein n=1 Tax=Phenylobacterium sp. TaxID=1871053 RepID=UPI002F4086EC